MSLQRHHHHQHSSPFAGCFRPSAAEENNHAPPPSPPPQTSGKTNLATSLYQTNLGLFSLTWSRTFLGHSLHLHLHPFSQYSSSSSPLSFHNSLSFSTLHFHLHIKPFTFCKKHGCKKLSSATVPNVQVYWDLFRAKFGSGPEPDSGFYIAVVVDGEMKLPGSGGAEAAGRRECLQQWWFGWEGRREEGGSGKGEWMGREEREKKKKKGKEKERKVKKITAN